MPVASQWLHLAGIRSSWLRTIFDWTGTKLSRSSKSVRQIGHVSSDSSHWVIHDWQNVWPHSLLSTGRTKGNLQIEHTNSSSTSISSYSKSARDSTEDIVEFDIVAFERVCAAEVTTDKDTAFCSLIERFAWRERESCICQQEGKIGWLELGKNLPMTDCACDFIHPIGFFIGLSFVFSRLLIDCVNRCAHVEISDWSRITHHVSSIRKARCR